MIKMPLPQPFEYAKAESWGELNALLNVEGWERYNLGSASDPSLDVIGFSYGDLSKHTIFMEFQIHGAHEWHTTHFALNFMEFLVNPPVPFKVLVNQLRSKFSFYIIPCLNPYGYLNNSYANANGVNLNRNFDYEWGDDSGEGGTPGTHPFSEPETQYVRDLVLDIKPVMFLDWHIAGSQLTSKTHPTPQRTRQYEQLSKDFGSSMKLTMEDTFYVDGMQNGPRARTWASTVVSSAGFEPIAMTPEIGGGIYDETKSRYSLSMNLMYCYYIMKWMETRAIPIE